MSNSEIDEGAVLVLAGQHKGRIGFYCLQNEQTYDMREIEHCPNCELSQGVLTRITVDNYAIENLLESPIEIETGAYCTNHQRALLEHELAVIYWDKPCGDDSSLIHISMLAQIRSTEYARYEKDCKSDVEKILLGSLRRMDDYKDVSEIPYRFQFKLAKPAQRQLIHDWLDQEHIRQWLHGDGLSNTYKSLDEFFSGSSWAKHWIAYDNDTPFAYLLTGDEENNAITLDLFICDLNYIGKGFGDQMIVEFLLSQFSDKSEVLIDPEASNTRAIHVYEKVGFRTIGSFIAPWHPVLHYKMRLDMKELLQISHRRPSKL